MKKVAIFGAGQLGSYLCLAARDLGIKTLIVSPDETSPAVQLADEVIIGELDEALAIQVAAQVDVVTFEREDIPAEIIQAIKATQHCEINPSPEIMALISDKGTQKQWLESNNFPTAPFRILNGEEEPLNLGSEFGPRFVQKARTGGFDGRGVQIVRDEQALWPIPSIIEPFVEHEMELAVLVARNAAGDMEVYPAVELLFESSANILKYALSPARISPETAEDAQAIGKKIATQLNAVGLLAVELFLTNDGELLVNEISPRVHNSGHLTIEANSTSQFEQHLRAICGLPLGSTEQLTTGAVMANTLFESNNAEACNADLGVDPFNDSTHIHWYGKRGAKTLRKMGHVTGTAGSIDLARTHVDQVLMEMIKEPQQ